MSFFALGYRNPDSNAIGIFCQLSGILNETSVAKWVTYSNDYYHERCRQEDSDEEWYGLTWNPITKKEMYLFLGILLKIGLMGDTAGGYVAHFAEDNHGVRGCVADVMDIRRFRQIRAAFHVAPRMDNPLGDTPIGFNAAANTFFQTPADMTLDEGGVGCRSKVQPCRSTTSKRLKRIKSTSLVYRRPGIMPFCT